MQRMNDKTMQAIVTQGTLQLSTTQLTQTTCMYVQSICVELIPRKLSRCITKRHTLHSCELNHADWLHGTLLAAQETKVARLVYGLLS